MADYRRRARRIRDKIGRSTVPPEFRGNPSVDPSAAPREPGELEAIFEEHIQHRMEQTGQDYESAKSGLLAEFKEELSRTPSGLDML